jgi:hypothetical protein
MRRHSAGEHSTVAGFLMWNRRHVTTNFLQGCPRNSPFGSVSRLCKASSVSTPVTASVFPISPLTFQVLTCHQPSPPAHPGMKKLGVPLFMRAWDEANLRRVNIWCPFLDRWASRQMTCLFWHASLAASRSLKTVFFLEMHRESVVTRNNRQ